MDNNKWTAEAVSDAILKNNSHLDIVFSNYLRTFIERLEDYDINLQEIINVDQLYRKIQDGIEKLEPMRKEFLSVVEIFAPSKHPFLKIYLPVFLEKLLNFYEEQGIDLYTGTNIDLIRNDHYRFFNQFLLISLAAMLVENNCFDALQAILRSKYRVYDKPHKKIQHFLYLSKCRFARLTATPRGEVWPMFKTMWYEDEDS